VSFYHYSQSNSGGSFDYDEEKGISVNVIIEADNANAADNKAEMIGLYFDGEGDCSCCGNRWYTDFEWDAKDVPCVYDTPVEEFDPRGKGNWGMKWIEGGYETFVHYADGTIKGYHK
jgi:hypothetical protein